MAFGAPPPGFMGMLDRKYALQGRDVAARELQAQSGADLNAVRAALLPTEVNAAAAANNARAADIREGTAQSIADFGDPGGFRASRIGQGFAQGRLYNEQANDSVFGRQPFRAPQVPQSMRLDQPSFDDRVAADAFWGGAPRVTPGPRAGGLPAIPDVDMRYMSNQQRMRLGFAKGTARVPGKGDGTKDTVPAKLAPGEAVLNKAAADKMGRGLIAAMNAQGARKMGMV